MVDACALDFIEKYVTNKVSVWIEEISILSDIAKTQPHAALAAYIHGLIHNYTFLCRTTPTFISY